MLSLRDTADAGGVERHRTGPRRLLDRDHHGVGPDQLLEVGLAESGLGRKQAPQPMLHRRPLWTRAGRLDLNRADVRIRMAKQSCRRVHRRSCGLKAGQWAHRLRPPFGRMRVQRGQRRTHARLPSERGRRRRQPLSAQLRMRVTRNRAEPPANGRAAGGGDVLVASGRVACCGQSGSPARRCRPRWYRRHRARGWHWMRLCLRLTAFDLVVARTRVDAAAGDSGVDHVAGAARDAVSPTAAGIESRREPPISLSPLEPTPR
jgi:hypothetical protein